MNHHGERVLLVTGGTGSIGRAVVEQALGEGWSVVIQGRRQATVNSLLDRLRSRFPEAGIAGFTADITATGAVEQLVREAANCHGRIDAVVDCLVTGPKQGGVTGPFATTDPAAYLPFAELSIVYLERLSFALLPWLKQARGCLVTVVSDAGLFPAPRQALIGAARAGAVGFVKNFAKEAARDGVRAHCISLSFVENTTTADKLAASGSSRLESARARAGLGLPSPSDIAPLALFLCGGAAERMTGQVISINGGLNI